VTAMAKKLNGHEVMAPSPEDPSDAALLACAIAFKAWSPEKQAAWPASTEFVRVSILCRSDPDDYGGEARLRAAIASCIADFCRMFDATALRGHQLSDAEMEARAGKAKVSPPMASPGYGYRVCPKCGGAKVVRGQKCMCALPVGGQPGYELFIIPREKR
jgi:hypothetical protein